MNLTKIKYSIADRFLEVLSEGILPWKLERPVNVVTKNKYNGINFLNLACVAFQKKYKSNLWGTYDQWHSVDMQVERRPADVKTWAADVLVWENRKYKKHAVFNTEQVFGKELGKYLSIKETLNQDYSVLDSIISNSKVTIEESSSLKEQAFLFYKENKIKIPHKESFLNKKQYYSTILHELSHWSENRLNWIGEDHQNELVAEMAVGFIESELNLEKCEDSANSLFYMPIWKKNIEDRPDYLFEAAYQAHKTSSFILSLQNQDK